MTTTADTLREEVRRRYAETALSVIETGRGCCGDGSPDASFGEALYDAEERGELPDKAVLASLGCGNPTAVAEQTYSRQRPSSVRTSAGRSIDIAWNRSLSSVTTVSRFAPSSDLPTTVAA